MGATGEQAMAEQRSGFAGGLPRELEGRADCIQVVEVVSWRGEPLYVVRTIPCGGAA
jgi:hypothetical protein